MEELSELFLGELMARSIGMLHTSSRLLISPELS
jgi:hypothetical protein